MIPYLIGFLLLVGIGIFIAGLFEAQQEAPEANIARRVQRVATVGSALYGNKEGESEVDKEFAREEERTMAGRGRRKTTYLPSLSKYTENYGWLARLEDDLTQARSPWRATELVVGSILLALLVLILCLSLRMGWISFLIALPVLILPRIYVKGLRAAYYRKFDDQLVDALMLMSNSLRAGFSFMQALDMVGKEAPSPIAEEFTRVTQEITIGVPVSDALLAMSERIKSSDLDLVVTAVIIQREVGGALANLLELIAAVIRERLSIKGEIRTLTAQGRLTGIILGFLPFIVAGLIYMVGKATAPYDPPFIMPLINTQLGNMILFGAVIWQLIGFFIIMRIVNIKV